jgi:ADP-heptose:LPS heptosyltransferase
MNIQVQSGLGDLINLLPYIEKLQSEVMIATNHPYALEPFTNIQTVPVQFKGILPIKRNDFQQLRYTRYGKKRYRDIYFKGDDYELYTEKVRDRYAKFYSLRLDIEDFIVFAPPHAAKRHQNKKHEFECTPDVIKTYNLIFSLRGIVVLVGKDDIYPELPEIQNVIDLRNQTTFTGLCHFIKNAKLVISQIGAITTLAGLFGIPTIFLPAANETTEQHQKHIDGVVWPCQEVIWNA